MSKPGILCKSTPIKSMSMSTSYLILVTCTTCSAGVKISGWCQKNSLNSSGGGGGGVTTTITTPAPPLYQHHHHCHQNHHHHSTIPNTTKPFQKCNEMLWAIKSRFTLFCCKISCVAIYAFIVSNI